MTRSLIGLLIALILPATSSSLADPPSTPADVVVISIPVFTDVPESHPFSGDVRWMVEGQITLGCDPPANARYCPDAAVTRGEMAVFLTRALDLSPADRGFVDIADSSIGDAASSIAAVGITRGCNPPANDRYCPDRPVTRGEMAAFLTRGFALPLAASAGFADTVGSLFEEAIDRLAAAEVTQGCNPPASDRYCPDRPVTRGEMAAFLRRAFDESPGRPLPEGVTLQREVTRQNGSISIGVELCASATQGISASVRRVMSGVDVDELVGVLGHSSASIETAGSYEPQTDLWMVEVSASDCESLTAVWNPNVVRPAWPVGTPIVVSPFGLRRHPILGTTRLHAGVDLRGRLGDPVEAAAAGTVTRAGRWGGYGNVVDVIAPGGMITRFAHLSQIDVVLGDVVERGDIIGQIGCTGLCTGPHLHFEMRPFDEPIDPVPRVAGPPPIVDPVDPLPD